MISSAGLLGYLFHVEKGNPAKQWFISRNQSYHGSTSGALSVGERPNLEFFRPLHSPLRSRVSECNYIKNKRENESENEYTNRLLDEFESQINEIGSTNISGFVAETMLGGLVGDVPPTNFYWKGIFSTIKTFLGISSLAGTCPKRPHTHAQSAMTCGKVHT